MTEDEYYGGRNTEETLDMGCSCMKKKEAGQSCDGLII